MDTHSKVFAILGLIIALPFGVLLAVYRELEHVASGILYVLSGRSLMESCVQILDDEVERIQKLKEKIQDVE